jgi:hypothetical protein
MIHVYGQGQPSDLGRPIFHHARGIRDVALAILAGLWVHELHTDATRHHEMHFGRGANGVSLYWITGSDSRSVESQLLAAATTTCGYIVAAFGRWAPLFLGRKPEDTAALWTLLSEALHKGAVASAA